MSNPLTHEWGGNARRAREAAGLMQTEAAARAGTTQHNLSRIERGEQLPMYDLQLQLADVYGIALTELFPRTDDEAELVTIAARLGNGCS